MATILVVEDHAMSRQILMTLLEYSGHRVLEASEGEEAFELACRVRPDLIISDILLPNMDGREFVRRLRTKAVQVDTPVIFYTAWCRHPEDIRLDESLKPCLIIPKPSEPQVILRTVSELLGEPSTDDHLQPAADELCKGCAKHERGISIELQLSVLMDLSYSMVAERDPGRLLNTFCRAVCEMLNCSQAVLAIQEENGTLNYYTGRTDNLHERSCPEHMILPGNIIEAVAAMRAPVRWGKCMMAVPFASPARQYGWISVMGRPGVEQLTGRDEEIIMTLSTQAALAYENMMLMEQLKRNNEIKDMFITNISHELRTPLNILLSNAQLFKLYLQDDRELDRERLRRKTDMQIRNCYRLIRLVNNFIDISKIESNHFELKPVKCNIVEVVEAIVTSTVEYARIKGIDLVFDTQQEEMFVCYDLDSIERILLNLLSNAIKFTPRGGTIYVNLSMGDGYVRISVKDTGIGIPEEKVGLIFERFSQVDNILTRKNEGSGIGLTVVKMLTEMHGGRVYVHSQYKKGSEFVVELPENSNGAPCPEPQRTANESGQDIIQRIKLEFSDIYF
ncbi:MAG TPA: hybrid sensor histidine kinase/response regulator [Clostridia bacterium]|nr:hybrid sensor histidine kinase/response regulator [Clostridia bacterium]